MALIKYAGNLVIGKQELILKTLLEIENVKAFHSMEIGLVDFACVSNYDGVLAGAFCAI
jgi:hypothetical protein